jgi:hypothetical protein
MPTTFNTTDPKPGYVYETATDTWFPLLGIAPGSSVVRWRKTAVGAETSVSGLDDLSATLAYNAGTEQVYLNGVLLVRTEDYLATTGTSITGLTALAASDVIEVIAFNATNVQITDALLETDINAKGDLIVGAAVDTAAILTSGTNGQVLSVNTATATGLEWVTSDDANAIQNAIVNAKGDLLAGTADNTIDRLAVGTNGQVLTAASGQATGLEWATPAAGGMTLLSTTSLSGTSTTISSISQSYNSLYISISGTFSTSTQMRVQWNGSTTLSFVVSAHTSLTQQSLAGQLLVANNSIRPIAWLEMNNYASSSKNKIGTGGWSTDYDDANNQAIGSIMYGSTSAITSITITNGHSATMTGTVLIYGVK